MSNWILYDDFVDLVRNHHHDGFSGLITGVSEVKHSFQVGFDKGEIVLLSYRIKKGLAALQLLTQIERAKISEHPNTEIQDQAAGGIIDTSTVLSQLTASTLDETSTTVTDISDVSEPRESAPQEVSKPVDARLRKLIESAAVHHFGPIGAMVCEEHLNAGNSDLRAVLLAIAQDVGASEVDTRAFFQAVTNH